MNGKLATPNWPALAFAKHRIYAGFSSFDFAYFCPSLNSVGVMGVTFFSSHFGTELVNMSLHSKICAT